MWAPTWATDRFARMRGRRDVGAVVLVRESGGREVVDHACPMASRRGVRAGMTVAHARALAGQGVVTAPADPDGDARGLAALSRFVSRRWTPTVSVDGPDGLLADITGCDHLFGSERRLVASLEGVVRGLGIRARVAAASTIGCAWAMARWSRAARPRVPPGVERRALEGLPVAALRIGPDACAALREVNVHTIGELMALPRSQVAARYAGVLLRLDQALGAAHEAVAPMRDAEVFRAHVDLPGATTRVQSIQLATQHVLRELESSLRRAESGARRVTARFTRVGVGGGEEVEVVVQTSRPTRDAKVVWGLFAPRVERMHLGFGVEAVSVAAGLTERMAHEQATIIGARRAGDARELDQALDVIANRIGADRVLRACVAQSHRPERASRWTPISMALEGVDGSSGPCRPRPSRLWSAPEEARVVALSPDGPVHRVTMRDGRSRVVVSCIGPERLGGEWWRGREGTRDYYRVQDEHGRWLWVYRDAGRWAVHGDWA